MKKLINDPSDVVLDSLRGIARLNSSLRFLGDSKTIVDIDAIHSAGVVAVISGGGAGHEPAHAGYVGTGMLAAAVSGDVFTSPSVDAVADAIRAVDTGAGVVLVVKNYTGDRLNFGLAAEIVRLEGIAAEVVVVGDDVALDAAEGELGSRGIAGTVLIHKIAGAAAAAGMTLQQVAARARQAADNLASMGIALGPCVLPAAGSPSFQLADDEVEWGLGIHGESGVERSALVPAAEVVDRLMSKTVDALGGPGVFEQGVALLVNNLGGSSVMEMSIIVDAALSWAQERGIHVRRVWSGAFLTAMEMAGCSISVLRLKPGQLAFLDAPAQTFAWPAEHLGRCSPDLVLQHPARNESTGSSTSLEAQQRAILSGVLTTIQAHEPELTEMDQVVGDGDLGLSLTRGAEAILATLEDLPGEHDGLFREMAAIIRRAIGGTSGPLISVLLLRMAEELEGKGGTLTLRDWEMSLSAGVQGMQDLGGASVGDRTMIDALIPALTAFGNAQQGNDAVADLVHVLTETTGAAKAGAESTAKFIAKKGRSTYMGDRVLGRPDPGAWAVYRVFEALRDAVTTQWQAVT